ncbi:glycosyltransferase [Spirillospora sp. NPDC048911]|uniref:glycosyltransferase n=1 Tax=Spirillospora sp. NPDC048911 TaxID=3364527 RepID=UPI0037163843
MTKVLHVITGWDRGGAEQQVLLLVRHLPVHCDIAVLTGTGNLTAAARAAGAGVHHIRMRGNSDPRAVPRLARLMRRGKYDVVHTHLYRACVHGRLAARIAGIGRVIATEHSLGDGHIEGRRTSAAVRLLYRATELLGEATIAVSPTVAHRLRGWGVPASRLLTLPNGIDPEAYAFDPRHRAAVRAHLGIGADEFIVGSVGRLVSTKRLDLLIGALSHTERGRLLIVGDGPVRGDLERLAADLGVTERVIFTGDRADVPAVLSAMDLYATPSTQETFGLSVLEALASGLPVLYSVCPALTDLPSNAAPQAKRLPPTEGAWRAAIEQAAAAPSRHVRLHPPPAVAHYAITRQIEPLVRLYEHGPQAIGASVPSSVSPA